MEPASAFMFTQGVLGVVCVVLAGTVVVLWRELRAKDAEHVLKLTEANDKRIADAKAAKESAESFVEQTVEAITASTTASVSIRESVVETRNMLIEVQEQLRALKVPGRR